MARMMEVYDYGCIVVQIEEQEDLCEFDDMVNQALNEGYQLIGDLTTLLDCVGRKYLIREVVKKRRRLVTK